uniref:N-acetyltransferase domain-containing protein n=1 Tax=Ditylenchus dipsaci TaxID=166011 RepID=A0A915CRM5_9BILA
MLKMWKFKAKEEVVLKRTEKVGNVTLAITLCLVNPLTHCYCWTVLDERKRTDETGRIQSGCAGCREIRSAKSSRVAKDTPVPIGPKERSEQKKGKNASQEEVEIVDEDRKFAVHSQHVYGSQHQHLEVQKNIMDKLLVCQDEQWASSLFGTADEIIHYVALTPKAWRMGVLKELAVAAKLYSRNFLLYEPELSTKFAYFSDGYEKVDTPLKEGVSSYMIRYSYGHFDVALE